jgi:hypothetical protein
LLPSSTASYTTNTSINSDIYQRPNKLINNSNNNNNNNNNHYNTNTSYTSKQQQQHLTNTLPVNTTRSLSESNFRLNNNILHTQITSNEEINQPTINEDKLLKEKREIVAKLEQQNKEIIKEIKRLKLQQLSNRSLDLNEQQKKMILKNLKENSSVILNKKLSDSSSYLLAPPSLSTTVAANPHIIAELQTLKQKKGLLENRMHLLENSRDELIGQLSQLDSVLKQTNSKQNSANNLSPRLKYSTLQSNNNNNNNNSKQLNQQSDNMSSLSLNNMIQSSSSSSPPQQLPLMQTSTFVPIVSASMALQIPLPQIQSQQQRSGIITNTSNRRSNPIANAQTRSWSTPNTPALYEIHTNRLNQQQQQPVFINNNSNKTATSSSLPHSSAGSLLSLTQNNTSSTGFINSTNGSTSNLRNLRNDLLIAADSVTNAMQSLVKELHSENEISFNTSSDDDDENDDLDNNNLNVYPSNIIDNVGKSNRCQSACSINLNDNNLATDLMSNTVIDQLNQMSRYSNSASVTPLTYRRNVLDKKTTNNQNHHQLLLRNAINFNQETNEFNDNNEEDDDDENEDEEENCLLTESFIDDPNMIEIANNNKALHLQQQQLQIQYQQQQLHLQHQQNQLIANLTNNNNEQVALWRRELEQRLIDNNDTNNKNINNEDEIDQDDDDDDDDKIKLDQDKKQ